ncbi:amino acid/polyamine transporter I [Aspergillus karnatakaensis]|uniref:amino acid/polyamine transporter I n=1 Tax=Aspergillus karnatakaensis TaxID=1810916 RepID=UPI003CCD068B
MASLRKTSDTIVKPAAEDASISAARLDVEDGTMEELGYAAVYRRVLRSAANLSIVLSLTSPLSAIFVTATYQITYAGYWGLTWGWFIPSVLVIPEVLAISELASSMPVNGAFYWWSGALAPPRWSHSVSFITGYLNILSIFTATAAFAYAVSSSFSSAVVIAVPDMAWTNAQLMGLSIGIVVLWSALMTLKLEQVAIIYMTMGKRPTLMSAPDTFAKANSAPSPAVLIGIQTLLFILGLPITHAVQNLPFAPASKVFGQFTSYSDWGPSVAVPYSWFCALWVNSAWMVPVYMAEETHRASIEIPKSLILTYSATAIVGLVVSIICAFCITDIDAAGTDITGYPLFTLILSHWGDKITSAFLLFVAPVGFIGGSGTLLTYANQIAAFARDKGLPYSSHMLYVHPRLNIPTYSVGFLAIGTGLVLLLSLSEEASNIIYSLSVVASLITFVIPIFFRIFASDRWVPGRFSLGRWSIPVHITALITQSYLIVMECFPPEKAWTVHTFNYNSIVTIGAIILSCIMYVLYGRKHFKGLDMEALNGWRRHHGVIVE